MALYYTEKVACPSLSLGAHQMKKFTLTSFLFLGIMATQAAAKSPFEEAYDYCWEQQAAFINEGVEMETAPLRVSGTDWNVTWGNSQTDTIAGDRIEASFLDGTEVISGHTMPMADHVLTIALHRDEGRIPFAVRYQGRTFLIVPYPANSTSEEHWCSAHPMN